GGLPHATRAGEQVAMGDATARHGAAQRGPDVVLDEQVREPFGTIFASESDHLRAILMRSGECGVRNFRVSFVRHDLELTLRIPHSPLRIAVEMPQAPRSVIRSRLAL